MVRFSVSLALALAVIAPGCTSTQAPLARRVGMVASIGGVVGLTASAGASAVTDTQALVSAFSIISAVGIVMYAVGELTDPRYEVQQETTAEKHQRWARILTERAFRYAREGNCPRVRRVEKRVNVYDREFHDFVFMRDQEIAKCMSGSSQPSRSEPIAPSGIDLRPPDEPSEPEPTPDPNAAPPPVLPPPSEAARTFLPPP